MLSPLPPRLSVKAQLLGVDTTHVVSIVTPQMGRLGVDTCHRTPTKTAVTQQRKPC